MPWSYHDFKHLNNRASAYYRSTRRSLGSARKWIWVVSLSHKSDATVLCISELRNLLAPAQEVTEFVTRDQDNKILWLQVPVTFVVLIVYHDISTSKFELNITTATSIVDFFFYMIKKSIFLSKALNYTRFLSQDLYVQLYQGQTAEQTTIRQCNSLAPYWLRPPCTGAYCTEAWLLPALNPHIYVDIWWPEPGTNDHSMDKTGTLLSKTKGYRINRDGGISQTKAKDKCAKQAFRMIEDEKGTLKRKKNVYSCQRREIISNPAEL